MQKPDMSVSIGNLKLKNPVMTASGTFGYGLEFKDFINLESLGAIIVKGISLSPSPGNQPPRIVETASGMLNAIGLENVGIEAFVKYKLPSLKKISTPVIVNIYGKTKSEYESLAGKIDSIDGISAIEVNISCPNVKMGGISFGADPHAAFDIISGVRKKTTLPVIAKLTPNVTDITVIAKSAEDAGADAVSLINTFTGMAIDIETQKPILANVTGGLSGPAIKPLALRMVWQTARAIQIPIIGIGGIVNGTDAIEFILAGATAVQIGSANFVDPSTSVTVIEGIQNYMSRKLISSVKEFVGKLIV